MFQGISVDVPASMFQRTFVDVLAHNFYIVIGKTKTVTRYVYKHIRAWRKIECYISGVRFRRERPSYRKLEDFSWNDFVERENLAKTFVVRHLPVGEDHFGGLLKDPPEWDDSVRAPVRKKARKGRSNKVKIEPQNHETTAVPMQYDVESGNLVPVIDLSW